jgi:N-acetylneuraminate synthase
MEPAELEQMILDINDAHLAIGEPNAWKTDAEKESVRLRPSLRFDRDLPAGTVLSAADFRSVRPAGGLAPKNSGLVLGKTLVRSVKHGDPVSIDDVNS